MSRLKKEILNKLKEYAGKMGKDHLGGDDYTSKKRGGLRDFDGYDNVDYNKDMPMDEGKYYITRNLGRGQGKALVKHYDKKKKQSTKPKEFKSYKDAQKEIDKLKRGGSMGGQMTAYFVTDKKMNRLNEAKDMTLSDYIKILDNKIEDAQKAVTGKNGSKEEYSNRGDILQNFKLFRNYLSAMDKRHKGNKTKLRFISENINEAKLNHYRITGNSIKFYVKDKGKNLVLHFKDKRDFDKLKLDLDNPKDLQKILDKRPKKMSISMGESVNEAKVNYNFSEDELKRVLKLLGRNASTEVKMIKAFEKAFGRKLTRDELFESINEGMFSMIDQIRQDSKDVRDFVKNVFKDKEFKKMSNDKDFIKYLKSIYEGVNEDGHPQNWMSGRTSDYHTALRGKNKDYSGGTNFKKKNHGQHEVEEDDEDQETNHLSNKQLHVKAKLKVAESGKKKSDKNYKDWKSSRLRKEISKKLKEYASRLTLSYIADKDSKLDGTPEDIKAIDEKAERDYKDEYKKFQSSKKSKKYRAELNKYNRDKGTYGNGDGKDASHKGGKIVGFESASKNRGRKEKSRLKKESVVNEIGQFPINNYIQGIIPQGRLDTNTPEAKRKSAKLVKDLRSTLNTFWKSHDIPYRIK